MSDDVERRGASLPVTEEERETLEEWATLDEGSRLACRARIVLKANEGLSTVRIARELGVSRQTVVLWRRRFMENRLDGIVKIRSGRGRRPTISSQTVRLILDLPTQPPPSGKKRWTVRAVAERAGVSPDTVQRIWRTHGLQTECTESAGLDSRRGAGSRWAAPFPVPAGGAGSASPVLASSARTGVRTGDSQTDPRGTARHGAGTNGLPSPFSTFIGRRHEIAEIEELLARSRLVTLTGCPGIGKSRLALETASRLASSYPDGLRLVQFDSVRDSQLVASVAAAALGVPEGSEQGTSSSLVTHVSDRQMLLVLDNCEHLVSACAELVRTLLSECPRVRVLVTSQEPMGAAGERVWQVPPLTLPAADHEGVEDAEAVRLFVERATSRSDLTLTPQVGAQVAELCRRLDGNPLAIELAAACVSTISPAEILERLDERFRLLQADCRTVPERHRTLGAAVAWSFGLLGESQKALLRRLSVFAGEITVEAAEQVCADRDLPAHEVFPALAGLVEHSLVIGELVHHQARYRLLQTIRGFAAERLEEAGERGWVRAQFSVRCQDLAEASELELAGPSQSEWLIRLRAEHDNLVAAIGYSLSDGRPREALRIAAATAAFWWTCGNLHEGLGLLEQCLEAVGPDESPAEALTRAKATWRAGLLAVMLGDFTYAQKLGEQSLRAAEWADDHGATARALDVLAQTSLYRGDLSVALELAECGVTAARRSQEARHLAEALERYGQIQILQGNPKTALPRFQECHRVARQLGDRQAEAFALVGQGWAAMDLGEYEAGEARFRLAEDLVRSVDDRVRTGEILVFLGELSRRRGDLCEAEGLLHESRQLANAMGVPLLQARSLGGLARVALARERYVEAQRLFKAGLALARELGFSYLLTRMLLGVSACARAEGDAAEARARLEEALDIARACEDSQAVATCHYALAGLARERGDLVEAGRLHAVALELHAELADSESTARSLEGLAGVGLDRDHPQFAARLFGAAQAQWRLIGRHFARWPWEAERYDQDMARLENALGSDSMAQLCQEGAARCLEEMVSYALRGTARRGRSSEGPHGLTNSEFDVARLAMRGLTSREVGERLFISPRTVDAHLASVYRKLGIGSRRELRNCLPEF